MIYRFEVGQVVILGKKGQRHWNIPGTWERKFGGHTAVLVVSQYPHDAPQGCYMLRSVDGHEGTFHDVWLKLANGLQAAKVKAES